MKACSFLPAATKMICDMGLQDLLYGVTFECPPESAGKPVLVRCVLEGKHYSSEEIDKIFSASKAQGKSLYYVEEELLQAIAPDIIFTQDVCEVCQIDTVCTATAIARLEKQPSLIPLTPANLQDVLQTAVTIATALGREEAAYHHLAGLQQRIDHIIDELRRNKAPLKRVMMMEWIAPVYNCGHWIPYQIGYAGGIDMLSNPGGDSIVTPWEKIVRYDPEVLVIAPCGFNTSRAAEEMHLLLSNPGWHQLKAVKDDAVFLADYDLFTQPSPGTLTDGIELLAALSIRAFSPYRKDYDPNVFRYPEKSRNMCKHEEKYCPRCKAPFECKVGDITQCQCYGIKLTPEERTFIEGRYEDCLCRKCLNELQQRYTLFREKYFSNEGR